MTPEERDWFHLQIILELAGLIEGRLEDVSMKSFLNDRDESDLTAFRLQAVGEHAGKLSLSLQNRHPHIAWPQIAGMRNRIAHDYKGIDPRQVWEVVQDDLKQLAGLCRRELASYD